MFLHQDSQVQTETENDSGCEGCETESRIHGDGVYREEVIPGKGIGCIALKDIPAGSLVIREVPALYVTPDLDGHAETIRAFAEMEPQDQSELLRLFNLYSKPETEWSESMRKELKDIEEDAGDLEVAEVSRETGMRVWQIWLTNAYDNGVFLRLSRFNHSCRPNTEYFWNTDLEVWAQDVRTVREVRAGEELTVCYRSFWPGNRKERRRDMSYYGFDCCCEGCDVTEEEEEEENQACEQFRQLQLKIQRLPAERSRKDLEEELTCLKDMFTLCRQIKTISLKNTLSIIVEEGFEISLELCEQEDLKINEKFAQDLKLFSTAGLELSTLLHGRSHSRTLQWRERLKNQ